MDKKENIFELNYNDNNNLDVEELSSIKIKAKKMYNEIDPELNKLVKEYLEEWKKVQYEISEMTRKFMSKIHNLKGYDIS